MFRANNLNSIARKNFVCLSVVIACRRHTVPSPACSFDWLTFSRRFDNIIRLSRIHSSKLNLFARTLSSRRATRASPFPSSSFHRFDVLSRGNYITFHHFKLSQSTNKFINNVYPLVHRSSRCTLTAQRRIIRNTSQRCLCVCLCVPTRNG